MTIGGRGFAVGALIAVAAAYRSYAILLAPELGVDSVHQVAASSQPVALPLDQEAAPTGPVELTQVSNAVRKPACANGLRPMIVLDPEKGTASGNWTVEDKDSSTWLVRRDGQAPLSTIRAAIFCE